MESASNDRAHEPTPETPRKKRAYKPRTYTPEQRERKRLLRRAWCEKNKDRLRAQRAANRENRRAARRKWYAGHKDVASVRRKAWALRNPQRERFYGLRKLYGLTFGEYERACSERGNLCDICKNPPTGKHKKNQRLHVDHNHSTGHLRGMLCSPCNKGLGHFADNLARMKAAVAYLRKHGSQAEDSES